MGSIQMMAHQPASVHQHDNDARLTFHPRRRPSYDGD
jgi:hypothetical protein